MSEFSARVAHELRTPLTLLRLRLEAAAPDLPPDFSEEVQEELRRLTNLVERSLLAAKAEGGRLEFTRTQVNFSALLEELRDGYSILATGKNLELEWRAPPSLGLRSDPGLLRQILHNLLGNCVRHGARRARLRVRAHPRGVLLTLSNFKPARQPAGEGNGLGLRLVRSLCAPLGCSLAIRQNRRVFSLRWILPSNGSLPRPRSVHSNRP